MVGQITCAPGQNWIFDSGNQAGVGANRAAGQSSQSSLRPTALRYAWLVRLRAASARAWWAWRGGSVKDETSFDAPPDHYLPLPDFRLPFTSYYANDLSHDGLARGAHTGSDAAGSPLGGESGAGDVAVLTEMLFDYGDTGSLPPLAEFADLPDPLDPSRHEPVEPLEPVEPTNAAELSGALLDEPLETPVGGLGNAAARGTSITLATQCVRFALQFCSLVVLARLLTPADFGIVAMVTAIVGVADILRDFGLSSAAIQAKTLNNAERSNLFWVNVGIGAAGAAVIMLCTPLIGRLYGQHHLTPIIFSLAWVLIISGANTQFNAELSRSLRFKALAFADIGAQTLGIAAAITVAALGGGYWAIVVQQIVV